MRGPESKTRRVIPRWRHFDDALSRSGTAQGALEPIRADIQAREAEWLRATDKFGIALDLVGVASTTGAPSAVAIDAAEWLLAQESVSDIARKVARTVVKLGRREAESTSEPSGDWEREDIAVALGALRMRLNDDPRNVLALVEQARLYTLIGQQNPAKQAIRRALLLAPNHRFVLRSAARFWVHLGEPDRAQQLLLRSARTKSDPWLLAPEISVSSLTDRGSRLVKSARLVLDVGKWSGRDVTELASAIGTLDLESGKGGRAKNLFRQSLLDPNDNSLAQAEWASSSVGIADDLRETLDRTERPYEAKALAAAARGDEKEAVAQAWLWLADQPFSSEAAVFGSYWAAMALDYDRSHEFARKGLFANPSNFLLRNNAACALAKLDRPAEAATLLSAVDEPSLSKTDRSTYLATQGLVAFRSGNAKRGAELYAEAISMDENPIHQALARIMLASEAFRLVLPGSDDLVAVAQKQASAALSSGQYRGWIRHLSATPRH